MSVLAIIAGLALLTVGAEAVVRGASRLAAIAGVSPIVIGLTVVALGTSAPELAIGVDSARQGLGDLALGNIAGTNIVNTLFILGLTAFIASLPIRTRVLRIDLLVMVAASVLLVVLSLDGSLDAVDGLILLAGAVAYTVVIAIGARAESAAVAAEYTAEFTEDTDDGTTPEQRWRSAATMLGMIAVGLAVIVVGAEWLVDGAASVASSLGVSEAFIGLTVVAIGTSAPELVTAIVAGIRGERDIAVGNLFGSSVYNILAILGLTAIAAPVAIPVAPELLRFDFPAVVVVSLLCIPVFMTGRRISRFEGGAFMALYVIYLTIVIATRT